MQVSDFVYLGRIKDLKSVMKTSTLQSRQMGKRENKIINIDGRVQFDLLQVNVTSYLAHRFFVVLIQSCSACRCHCRFKRFAHTS